MDSIQKSQYAIEIKNLIQIFGADTSRGLELLKEGKTKANLLNEEGMVLALNNVSYTADFGKINVIMGLSGSGKSTLIRCINRLVNPTAGKILVDGENIVDMNHKRLREIRNKKLAMVFQNYGLLSHLSVLENVTFGLKIRKVSKQTRWEKAKEVLELVGLKEWGNSRPHELSGGMQQRVGLARALALDTPIILMDEPFSGLDPLIRNEMHAELLKLQGRLNKTIIFITHSMNEAITIGDKITIIRDGEIIDQGTPHYMVFESEHEYVVNFTKECNPLKILKAADIVEDSLPVLKLKDGKLQTIGTVDKLKTPYHALVLDEVNVPIGTTEISDHNCLSERFDLQSINNKIMVMKASELLVNHLKAIAQSTRPVVVVDSQGKYLGGFSRMKVLKIIAKDTET